MAMEEATAGFMPKKKKSALKEEKRKREIPPGSLMKALIRPGGGSAKPQEGDQIIFHYTTRTENGAIVESTRSEHGGRGYPIKLVLGKSKMILGWEEGITSMLKGEVAMVQSQIGIGIPTNDCTRHFVVQAML